MPDIPQDPVAANIAWIPAISTPPPVTEHSSPLPMASAELNLTVEEEAELAELAKTEILARNADALDAQLEERPLAKKQEQLQETDDSAEGAAEIGANGHSETLEESEAPRPTTPKPEKHVRKALLKNDDVELVRVQKVSTCMY